MTWVLLSAELVEAVHNEVLNPGELQGRARDKSLDAAMGRVDNRLAYGMIVDVFDLAAANAIAVGRGHCFNDGNKRTAFRAMNAVLALNGVQLVWDPVDVGQTIIRAAQGLIEEPDLAEWLRGEGT